MDAGVTSGGLRAALDRVGVEIELLAPPGVTRREVAGAIADEVGGSRRSVFAFGTEPARKGPNKVLHHLSRGMEVATGDGTRVCQVVDDLTIRDGLTSELSSDGDYRIVADDKRLLHLIKAQANPDAVLAEVLDPVAVLFGQPVHDLAEGKRFAILVERMSVASALLQLADRQRVCEIVTAVIDRDHREALDRLLGPARDIGCTVPTEAAVHVHFDAEPFRRADRFAGLVELFEGRREELRERFGTNLSCRHLGPLPEPLVKLVRTPGFRSRPWSEVEELTRKMGFNKFIDLNLRNLRFRIPDKDTVEVRLLPGASDAGVIAGQIEELQELLAELD